MSSSVVRGGGFVVVLFYYKIYIALKYIRARSRQKQCTCHHNWIMAEHNAAASV